MKRLLAFTALAFLHGLIAASSADEIKAVWPAPLRDVLAVLPEAPDGWEIVRSDADSTLTSWLEAHAVRVFRVKPKPEAPSQAPLGEVEVRLSDTGGYPSALADFADFQPGKDGKYFLGSYPAILTTEPDGARVLEALLGQRFILTVTVPGAQTGQPERWLQALSFDALGRLFPGRKAPLPRQVEIAFIDELHPERTRSYTVARGSSVAVETAARKSKLAAEAQTVTGLDFKAR